MVEQYNIRLLCQNLFEYSKRLAFFVLTLRILAFLIGATLILLSLNFAQLPFLIALLTLFAEMIQWRSEVIKNTGESLLRNLELQESLGWPISNSMISDTLAIIPTWMKKKIRNKHPEQEYFASRQQKPVIKALENLQESSWWSKHLANRMGYIYLAVTIFIVFISIVTLLVSIETITSFMVLQNISRIVASTIMLIFSLKFIRLTVDYFTFSKRSQQIESKAEQLTRIKKLNELVVVSLFHEYQLVRATSPLLPTWLWKYMNPELNALWNAYRSTTSQPKTEEQ